MSPDPDYDLISDEDLSRQMMPRIAVPDHESWLARDLALSNALKDRVSVLRDQRYGEGPRQLADLYPAPRPGAPIMSARRPTTGTRPGSASPSCTSRTSAALAPAAWSRVTACSPFRRRNTLPTAKR